MKHLVIVCVCLLFLGLCGHAQKPRQVGHVAAPVFQSMPVPDTVFARMRGRSYPEGCPVKRSELRYLRVSHCDLAGNTRVGELVCNVKIARELLTIFKQLFEMRYPIASLRLIDDFNADDEQSMQANNSSCFCYRKVKGHGKLSAHARGMAVDLNPLYNPYCRRLKGGKTVVQPANARRYCDRIQDFPCKITSEDVACRLFKAHGFKWGGDWKSVKDYQHFEK